MLSHFNRYCLINVLVEIMFIKASLLNHKSCLYPGTVALWVTNRVPPLSCTVIFFPDLVIFSTRYELYNRSIVEQLSNYINFLRSKLISLMWFCLKKTSSLLFQRFG